MNNLELSFQQAKEVIESSQNILFTTHERTDGDDLGTVLALALYAKSQGKKVSVVITGGVPSRLEFMPMSDEVQEPLPQNNFDLLIVSGCSNIERVNHPEIQSLQIPTINFDHHPDNQNYANINVVDSTKSSVAELTYDFFQFCGWEMSSQIATCLLTGIITDTGLFMHSNTGAETLEAASKLMSHGARISQVTKHTFTSPDVDHLKAWGVGLQNSYFNPENKIIYSVLSQETLKKLGNPELANFEGLVETLNKVPEAKYAMLLKEEDGRIKGSLRSDPHKGVDVKEIAHTFGGGGHKWAAGFTLVGKLVKTDQGKWQVESEQQKIDLGT
jgi:bifunctional oligoribonuclease and PAP phosphatase NrnA